MVRASCQITLACAAAISKVARYYKIQSSTLSIPSKPVSDSPSGWSETEPVYQDGMTSTLYFVDKTSYTDGTFQYSDVSVSSSYEAAKSAYNAAAAALSASQSASDAAQQAQDTATSAQSAVTDLSARADQLDEGLFNAADSAATAYNTADAASDAVEALQSALNEARSTIAEIIARYEQLADSQGYLSTLIVGGTDPVTGESVKGIQAVVGDLKNGKFKNFTIDERGMTLGDPTNPDMKLTADEKKLDVHMLDSDMLRIGHGRHWRFIAEGDAAFGLFYVK